MSYEEFITLFNILKNDIQSKSDNLKQTKQTLDQIEEDIINASSNIGKLYEIEHKHKDKRNVLQKNKTII